MVAGGVLLSAWGGLKRRMSTSLLGTTGMCLSVLVVALAPSHALWLALVGIGFFGLTWSVHTGAQRAALQSAIAPAMQGRYWAVHRSLFSCLGPISLAIAAPLADVWGVRLFWFLRAALTVIALLIRRFTPDIYYIEDAAQHTPALDTPPDPRYTAVHRSRSAVSPKGATRPAHDDPLAHQPRRRRCAPRCPRRRASPFAALRHRNYRLWFFGQTISQMGTWMQSVAQGWVVYQLTGSELALGTDLLYRLAAHPLLMLPAGVIADRMPKRKVLIVAQAAMMCLAFILAAPLGDRRPAGLAHRRSWRWAWASPTPSTPRPATRWRSRWWTTGAT